MKDKYVLTAESVTEGHPDKLCDTIADAVVDACLEHDPTAHVACEVMATAGKIIAAGEITAAWLPDIPAVICRTVREAGYGGSDYEVEVITREQSPDIAGGVDRALEAREGSARDERDSQGAGDQGIMFGFATNETPELLPAPIVFAHKLLMELAKRRKRGHVDWLRPDCKSQVAVAYDEAGRPVHIENVVISTQHTEEVDHDTIYNYCVRLIKTVLPAELLDDRTEYFINPTGKFVVGGPHGDSGLTGRKIIVDTYGGYARHGGGAFSGKDPSKVDRSAAYAARWVAKNVVAAGLATKCEVELAYAIGVAKPVSIMVDTFGTGTVADEKIVQAVEKVFDLTPAAIIRDLDLRKPIYRQLAAYGHMGREDLGVKWENTDRVDALKAAVAE